MMCKGSITCLSMLCIHVITLRPAKDQEGPGRLEQAARWSQVSAPAGEQVAARGASRPARRGAADHGLTSPLS